MIDPNRPMAPEPELHGVLTFPSGVTYRATSPCVKNEQLEEKPSGIGDIQCTMPMPLLAKVLPSGGPLLKAHWTCPTCGLTMRGSPPRVCMDDCNPDCPIGGDQ